MKRRPGWTSIVYDGSLDGAVVQHSCEQSPKSDVHAHKHVGGNHQIGRLLMSDEDRPHAEVRTLHLCWCAAADGEEHVYDPAVYPSDRGKHPAGQLVRGLHLPPPRPPKEDT